MNAPSEILVVLDRLNAHARGKSRSMWGWDNEAKAIYAYKQLAATKMIELGAVQARLVKVDVACGCDNGRFTIDYDIDERKPITVRCRYCSSAKPGRRTLRFTETAFAGGIAWHHPWEGRVTPGFEIARAAFRRANGPDESPWGEAWHDAGDWKPRMGGAPLALNELVPLLNFIETWVEGIQPVECSPTYSPSKTARRMLGLTRHEHIVPPLSAPYRLDLGRAAGGCHVCGSEDPEGASNLGCMSLFFHWSQPACKAHRGTWPEAPPDALMIPAVREWIARHERIVEVQ